MRKQPELKKDRSVPEMVNKRTFYANWFLGMKLLSGIFVVAGLVLVLLVSLWVNSRLTQCLLLFGYAVISSSFILLICKRGLKRQKHG